MDFRQSLSVKLGLEQRLVMTQQLQQAIRLLQLSRTELADSIAEALNENPVLEEAEIQPGAGETGPQITQGEGTVQDFEAPAQPAERTEIDWQNYFTDLARAPSEGVGSYRDTDEERPALAQTLTKASTLDEVLGEQLGALGLGRRQLEIASEIIGNLDDDGYFRPSRLDISGGSEATRRGLARLAVGIEQREERGVLSLYWLTDDELIEWQELAESRGLITEVYTANSTRMIAAICEVPEAEVLAMLKIIQGLEPLGVAARDLQECLMTQALTRYPGNEELHRLIEVHLPRLQDRDYQAVRRDLHIGAEELEELLKVLASLEPRPGRRYTGEMARYITPDVFVSKIGDDYVVTLNEDGLPKLKISNYYKSALMDEQHHDSEHDKAKHYLQEKLRAATWMIRSIHQRQSTIQRVTESIMRFQRPFLDGGVDKLRPLVLRDVADDVGLHESTISRVTTSKYVHTPQGIFELKFFFGSRITAQGGDDMAAEAVKQAIKRLIDKEIPSSPLSDQEIAEILQGEWDRGRMLARMQATESQVDAMRPNSPMTIARRTVAKYREQLGIESSSKRRRSY